MLTAIGVTLIARKGVWPVKVRQNSVRTVPFHGSPEIKRFPAGNIEQVAKDLQLVSMPFERRQDAAWAFRQHLCEDMIKQWHTCKIHNKMP